MEIVAIKSWIFFSRWLKNALETKKRIFLNVTWRFPYKIVVFCWGWKSVPSIQPGCDGKQNCIGQMNLGSGDRQGCTPIPTYPYGKSRKKSPIYPYIVGVYGLLSQMGWSKKTLKNNKLSPTLGTFKVQLLVPKQKWQFETRNAHNSGCAPETDG